VHLKGRADRLTVKVYTRALVCVGSAEAVNVPAGWSQVPLPSAALQDSGAGTFFYVISGQRDGAKTVKDAVGRVVVLR